MKESLITARSVEVSQGDGAAQLILYSAACIGGMVLLPLIGAIYGALGAEILSGSSVAYNSKEGAGSAALGNFLLTLCCLPCFILYFTSQNSTPNRPSYKEAIGGAALFSLLEAFSGLIGGALVAMVDEQHKMNSAQTAAAAAVGALVINGSIGLISTCCKKTCG